MAGKFDGQGPPPSYPQAPMQAHHDQYQGQPGAMQPAGYYQQGPPQNQDYYGNSPGPGYQQGPYGPPQGGQYGQPQQGMNYQQGPPPQGGYYQDNRKADSGGGGLFAGLCAGLACCCCLDCLF